MDPVHSRPRCIRSDRGLPQRGGVFPFGKLMRRRPQRRRRQRGGWLSQSVVRIPGMDLAQRLAQRRRYKNPSRRGRSTTRPRRRRRRR